MVKRFVGYIIVLLLALFTIFSIYKIMTVETHVFYTENAEDYNTDKYPITEPIFLSEIPENASVVRFSYYDYWYEVLDIYLELKFNTADEMKQYLSELELKCQRDLSKFDNTMSKGAWFSTEDNPYMQGYTDMFCLRYITNVEKEYYTGYQVVFDDNEFVYECNYGIISYSFEDLTVIQSRTRGHIRESIHEYIPEYLVRFSALSNQEHKRFFYIKNDDS